MSYLHERIQKRIISRALSLFDALEANTQTRVRLLVAAGGMITTVVMWLVHLTYPQIFQTLIQEDSVAKLLVGFVLAPPFVVAFSIGSFISPQVHKPVQDESGPMSGYFYRERADKKYRLLICAGLFAGLNLILMIATCAGD